MHTHFELLELCLVKIRVAPPRYKYNNEHTSTLYITLFFSLGNNVLKHFVHSFSSSFFSCMRFQNVNNIADLFYHHLPSFSGCAHVIRVPYKTGDHLQSDPLLSIAHRITTAQTKGLWRYGIHQRSRLAIARGSRICCCREHVATLPFRPKQFPDAQWFRHTRGSKLRPRAYTRTITNDGSNTRSIVSTSFQAPFPRAEP